MGSTEHVEKLQEYIDICMHKGDLSPRDLVQLFEQNNLYMNLKTIPQYAKDNNISYNGAKKCRNIIELFGVKFVQDE